MQSEWPPERREEIDSFFDQSLPLLDPVLTLLYRLGEEEAVEVEGKLHCWFRQFAERPGIDELPLEGLEETLLVAACRYAREVQLEKLGGASSRDPGLDEVLSRPPEKVAIGVLIEFEKRGRQREQ